MAMERSREYMNARRVAKELETVTRGLNRNMPATPPTVDREEMKQVIMPLTSTRRLVSNFKVQFKNKHNSHLFIYE
jgi:hypothetical protein